MKKTIFSLAILIVFLGGCSFKYNSIGYDWSKEVSFLPVEMVVIDEKGCRLYNPFYSIQKITWSGACQDGYANGNGVLQGFSNGKSGSTYNGMMVNGKINGKGIFTYADGDKYEGDWKNNKKEGKGIFTFADGGKYEGDFKDGKKEGKGVEIYYKGGKYEGDFKDGKKEGKGVEIYPDGSKYEGEFKNDISDGKGIFTQINGTKEEGYFKNRNKVTIFSENGIANDNATGLVWQDNNDARNIVKDWNGAKAYCENLNLGGFSDWRLPNIYELATLIDKTGLKNEASWYWSSTTSSADTNYVWRVGGYKWIGMSEKPIKYAARCVRGKRLNFNDLVVLEKTGKIKINQENMDSISKNASKDQLLEDELAYKDALSKNSIDAYKEYIQNYSSGLYVSKAQSKISELTNELKDKSAYDVASSTNTINSYKEYLKKFPNGNYTQSAKSNMYDLTPEGIAKRKKEAEIATKERKKEEERERVEKSNSQTTSSSSYNYIREISCSFCCTGQWGACTSDKIEVKVKANNISEAIDLIRNKYENVCGKIPFYKGGGYPGSSVGYPNCN